MRFESSLPLLGRNGLVRRPLIDIDLGLGRQWGYNDTVERYRKHIVVTSQLPRNPATCHPFREHKAHGLCGSCYNTWRGRWRRMNARPIEDKVKRQVRAHLVRLGHEA